MKTFIYVLTFENAKFGKNVTLSVYRVIKNKPEFLFNHTYNTGSFRGHDHEALDQLIKFGYLPKSCSNRGYINYDKLGKVFQLYPV